MLKSNNKKRLNRIKIKYSLIVLTLVLFIALFCRINPTFMRYYSEVTAQVVGYAKETHALQYTVVFDANGGTGTTMTPQVITYGQSTPLTPNSYTYSGHVFNEWNTEPDGSGQSYDDEESVLNLTNVNNGTVTLYAQWLNSNAVAEIGGQGYNTLQDAIDAAPNDDTLTVIKLLKNTSGKFQVQQGQNIQFNLQSYTISNNGNFPVIENYGTILMTNGTITSNASQGAINNKSTGVFTISGGSITATGNRQAIFNDGGKLYISGTAYLSASAQIEANKPVRGTVQNNTATSKIEITGGTIVSPTGVAVASVGQLSIGTHDGTYNSNSPVIQGEVNGLHTTTSFNFYDGIIKGATAAIVGENYLSGLETAYGIDHGTDGNYNTAFLVPVAVTTYEVIFDPTLGSLQQGESPISVVSGDTVGTLPLPTSANYGFTGWYTLQNGGERIDDSRQIINDITFYAHWIPIQDCVASIGVINYDSLQNAISDVPTDNTATTVKLLKNRSECVTVAQHQNIAFDFQNYTLDNNNQDVNTIKNYGTINISNGTVTSNAPKNATIDTYTTGKTTISGGNIIATGNRQAVYNEGGHVTITGTAYLSANAPVDSGKNRGTAHNYSPGGTMIITGGTIVSTNMYAISNEGIMYIGTKGGGVDTSTPVAISAQYGLFNKKTISFYDGIIKGATNAFKGNITFNELEPGYQVEKGTDGNYETAYLVQQP